MSKGSRGHIFPILGARETHVQKGSLGVKKERATSHDMWCQGSPIILWAGIYLEIKVCACMLGKVLGQVRCGGGYPKNSWPKLNKDPEELLYATDLPASLLYPSSWGGRPQHFSPGVHLCLASTLNKQTLSLLLSHLCCVSNNKLRTVFCFLFFFLLYRFCLLEKCIF